VEYIAQLVTGHADNGGNIHPLRHGLADAVEEGKFRISLGELFFETL
jgi:hypothetical protein